MDTQHVSVEQKWEQQMKKTRIPRIKISKHELNDFPLDNLQPCGSLAFLYDSMKRPNSH